MPTTIYSNLRTMAVLQLVIGLSLSLALSVFWSPQQGASFGVGAGLMLVNLGLLAWTSWRLMEKKPIAWTVLIIVIKYAVLLGSVVYFARTDWFHSLTAGLGVASFVLAILGAAILGVEPQTKKVEN